MSMLGPAHTDRISVETSFSLLPMYRKSLGVCPTDVRTTVVFENLNVRDSGTPTTCEMSEPKKTRGGTPAGFGLRVPLGGA